MHMQPQEAHLTCHSPQDQGGSLTTEERENVVCRQRTFFYYFIFCQLKILMKGVSGYVLKYKVEKKFLRRQFSAGS